MVETILLKKLNKKEVVNNQIDNQISAVSMVDLLFLRGGAFFLVVDFFLLPVDALAVVAFVLLLSCFCFAVASLRGPFWFCFAGAIVLPG